MNVLNLVPQGWFSWDFTVLQDGSSIAEIDISAWREKGVLVVGDSSYAVYRDGFMGPFILEFNGTQMAVANKSALSRSFAVQHAGNTYTLKAESPLGRRFVLLENGQEIGSIAPDGFLTRKATAVLPDELPCRSGFSCFGLRLFCGSAKTTVLWWLPPADSSELCFNSKTGGPKAA